MSEHENEREHEHRHGEHEHDDHEHDEHEHSHGHGHHHGHGEEEEELEPKKRIALIVIAAVLFAAALIMRRAGLPGIAVTVTFIAAYAAAAWPVIFEAVECAARREFFEESTLMTVATIGAMAIGEFAEAVAVIVLFHIGELLEDMASDRSRRSIEKLMEIRPDTANLALEDGSLSEVPVEDVEPGAVIAVKPGERVPLDCVILSGSTALDVSALTGESAPVSAAEGDGISSGSVNLTGLIRAEVVRPASESTVSRILELVEDAGERKARYQGFTERFAHVYTPVVVCMAVLLAVIPSVITGDWSVWLYRGLEFLVVSCPCAFVISVPMTFVSGMGAASRRGVLIKGSAFVERLAGVKTVVMDKTGTLTEGSFEISRIVPAPGVSEERLLSACAAAETYSDHPVAVSVRRGFEERYPGRAAAAAGASENIAGRGVVTEAGGEKLLCGSAELMAEYGVSGLVQADGTAVHCAVIGGGKPEYLGCVAVSDKVKDGSREAVSSMHGLGVSRAVMLTGDGEAAAKAAAEACGITEYRSGLMPEDKVTELEKLMITAPRGSYTAFIGDGVNDAPVLARADVGIAMGALGSDAAIEAADAVLMDDDPRKASLALKIASKTMRVVRQNVAMAIGLKAVILLLCALGLAPMWAAVFGDVGVTMLCCLNALRAGRV